MATPVRIPLRGIRLVLVLCAMVCATLSGVALRAAEPCCTVVTIDRAKGVVTLRDTKTGKLEKVVVQNPARLAKLSAGQAADRSIGKRIRYCSIATYEPCLDQERTHNCQPCPD